MANRQWIEKCNNPSFLASLEFRCDFFFNRNKHGRCKMPFMNYLLLRPSPTSKSFILLRQTSTQTCFEAVFGCFFSLSLILAVEKIRETKLAKIHTNHVQVQGVKNKPCSNKSRGRSVWNLRFSNPEKCARIHLSWMPRFPRPWLLKKIQAVDSWIHRDSLSLLSF